MGFDQFSGASSNHLGVAGGDCGLCVYSLSKYCSSRASSNRVDMGGANHLGAGWRQHSFPHTHTPPSFASTRSVRCSYLQSCVHHASIVCKTPSATRDSSHMQHSYDYPIYIPAITCFRHLLSSFFSFSASRLLVVLRRESFLLQ